MLELINRVFAGQTLTDAEWHTLGEMLTSYENHALSEVEGTVNSFQESSNEYSWSWASNILTKEHAYAYAIFRWMAGRGLPLTEKGVGQDYYLWLSNSANYCYRCLDKDTGVSKEEFLSSFDDVEFLFIGDDDKFYETKRKFKEALFS